MASNSLRASFNVSCSMGERLTSTLSFAAMSCGFTSAFLATILAIELRKLATARTH